MKGLYPGMPDLAKTAQMLCQRVRESKRNRRQLSASAPERGCAVSDILAPLRQIPGPDRHPRSVRVPSGGDYERGAHTRLVFMNLDRWMPPVFNYPTRPCDSANARELNLDACDAGAVPACVVDAEGDQLVS